VTLKGVADGLGGIDAPTCGSADDGADGGKEIGAPVGADAAGDLPVGGSVTEIALGRIVVGCDLGLVEEGEEVLAQQAVAVGGSKYHDGVEVAFEATAIFVVGVVGQAAMAARQRDGAQQQRLHARGEDGVARFHGEATIAQLMCQADLPGLGMATLGAVEVRDPDRWAMAVHHLVDDTGAAAAADHVDHHLGVLEHPVPTGAAIDAHAGLIRPDDTGAAQARQDGGGLGVEARLGASQRGIQRPE